MSDSSSQNFQDLYEVVKTVRFELRPLHFSTNKESPEYLNFQKTQKWLENNRFNNRIDPKEKEDRNEKIHSDLEEIFEKYENIKSNLTSLLTKVESKNLPKDFILVKYLILENIDRNLYHHHRKGINKTKFQPLTHINFDSDYYWFFIGFKNSFDFIDLYKNEIESHRLWTEDDYQKIKKHARWYQDIESFCNRFIELTDILQFIKIATTQEIKDCENYSQEQKNLHKKFLGINDFTSQNYIEELTKQLIWIKRQTKENNEGYIEAGIGSLNIKAVNKDKNKNKRFEWLKNKKEEQKNLVYQIEVLDNERKILLDGDKKTGKTGLYHLLDEESQRWVNEEIDKCPDFAIHLLNTPKYNQKIQEKIEELKNLRKQDNKDDVKITQLQNEVYKLKIRKGLIQDRKRIFLEKGVLSFELFANEEKIFEEIEELDKNNKKFTEKVAKLLNFQYKWEKKFKTEKNGSSCNFLNIENNYSDNRNSPKYNRDLNVNLGLLNLYRKNIDLIKKKKKLSQQLGNSQKLVNSIQREIERQNKLDYWSVLFKDKEFFYLGLVKEEDKEKIKKEIFREKSDSNYQALQYERLTFKALEKLALVQNATININNIELQETWQKYFELESKSYSDEKIEREGWQSEKIKKEKKRQEGRFDKETKNNLIQEFQKIIKNLGYDFTAKQNYRDLEEFAKDIDNQCYKTQWLNIDWNKTLELENKGEIRLFKIHNKDFNNREKTKKLIEGKQDYRPNLFSKYWIYLIKETKKENPKIKLLPEIDLFVKYKEKNDSTEKYQRKTKDKFYGSFRLVFYPNKILSEDLDQVEVLSEKVNNHFKNKKVYYLGLDRGENELITYCLINQKGQIMEDSKGKNIIGNWNIDDSSNLNDFKNKKGNDGKFNYTEKFEDYQQIRAEILAKDLELLKHGKESPEYQKVLDLKAKLMKEELAQIRKVKEGFTAHVLEKINEIISEFKNVYIVLEDLNRKIDDSGKVRFFVDEDEKDYSRTEQGLNKTIGANAYQEIENAIINKFKYYQSKDNQFNGIQLTPNISRVQDLREVENPDKLQRNKFGRIMFAKSKDQIGNVLFVPEDWTSRTCPCCGFKPDFEEENLKNLLEKTQDIIKINENYCLIDSSEKILFELKNWNLFRDGIRANLENGQLLEKLDKLIQDLLETRSKRSSCYSKDFQNNDIFVCQNCGYSTNKNTKLKSADEVAAYNVAKNAKDKIYTEK